MQKIKCSECNKEVIRIHRNGKDVLIDKTFGHEWFYVRGDLHKCNSRLIKLQKKNRREIYSLMLGLPSDNYLTFKELEEICIKRGYLTKEVQEK